MMLSYLPLSLTPDAIVDGVPAVEPVRVVVGVSQMRGGVPAARSETESPGRCSRGLLPVPELRGQPLRTPTVSDRASAGCAAERLMTDTAFSPAAINAAILAHERREATNQLLPVRPRHKPGMPPIAPKRPAKPAPAPARRLTPDPRPLPQQLPPRRVSFAE